MNNQAKKNDKRRMIKTEQKQILICRDDTKKSEVKLESSKILKPDILGVKKEKQIIINECNAAEKIENYPINIQKLVWRALYYNSEIRARKSMVLRGHEQDKKITKYIDAFRHTQQLILRMCKKYNLKIIILENKLKNIYDMR